MNHKKVLGGQIDPGGFKYFIASYLPEPFKAAQDKHRDEVRKIITDNKAKGPGQRKTKVRVVGQQLLVDNKVAQGPHPPSFTWRYLFSETRISYGAQFT